MAEEVTSEMIAAGQRALVDWHVGGQSGPVQRAVYLAMREAAGVEDLESEAQDFTVEMLHAGRDAEAEWHAHQSGPREIAIYLAMRAAA